MIYDTTLAFLNLYGRNITTPILFQSSFNFLETVDDIFIGKIVCICINAYNRLSSDVQQPRWDHWPSVADKFPMFLCYTWLCIVCIKCTKPLMFDGPAKTDVVRRFPTFAKVFIIAQAGN